MTHVMKIYTTELDLNLNFKFVPTNSDKNYVITFMNEYKIF